MKITKFTFYDKVSASYAASMLKEVGLGIVNESTEWSGRDDKYKEWYVVSFFE